MLPEFDPALKDDAIEEAVKYLQQVILLGRRARERRLISLKKPIQELIIVHHDSAVLENLKPLKQYIESELNMEVLSFDSEEKKYCTLYAKPDAKKLGKRLGKKFKSIKKAINELTHEEILSFESSGSVTFDDVTLGLDDLIVQREVKVDAEKYEALVGDDGKLVVIIDVVENENLIKKFTVRKIITLVQNMRKEAGLKVTDKVQVFYEVTGSKADYVVSAINENKSIVTDRLRSSPFKPKSEYSDVMEILAESPLELDDAVAHLTIVREVVDAADIKVAV